MVLDDFELTEKSARLLVTGAMVNAGQVCAAQTRILVPAARHDEIVGALSEATRAQRVGDPVSADDRHRPADLGQAARPGRALHQARRRGRRPPGHRRQPPGHRPGWYVQPTLFADVDNAMTIAREEIFGPVARSSRIRTRPRPSPWRTTRNTAWRAPCGPPTSITARRSPPGSGPDRLGGLAGPLDAYGPFGGFKNSGYGREGGTEALDDYTEPQTIILPARAN